MNILRVKQAYIKGELKLASSIARVMKNGELPCT